MEGKIVSISVSKKKGTRKYQVEQAVLKEEHGIVGDAHSGPWHRQVSLLACESIMEARRKGLDVGFGDFAENIATEGVEWDKVPVGAKVFINNVVLEVTQIGKKCHRRCAIFYLAGDCLMPRKGVFARVLKGGVIKVGDKLRVTLPMHHRHGS